MISPKDAWIKYFSDRTVEVGSDFLINKGEASWSKGRKENISKVSLSGFGKAVILEIPNTEWFQFDKYIMEISSNNQSSIRIARVIKAKLQNSHINNYLCYNINKNSANVLFLSDKKQGLFSTLITKSLINNWISIVISNDSIDLLVGPNRGSVNGDKPIFR